MPPDPSVARPFVHPTATVEPGAVIGLRSKIWHYAHVRAGATIGADCVLGKGVFVDAAAIIGDGCKIQNNVSLYSGVTLEDEVFVGPSAVFINDLVPRALSPDWTITPTVVERGASIGANATILSGLTIGHSALVAAGAVVTHTVAPHQLVAGSPARPQGWVCWCGVTISRGLASPADLRCDSHSTLPRSGLAHPGLATLELSVVDIGMEEESLVLEVLRSGRLAQGPKVELLEREFAAAHEVSHAVAVTNGTAALVAALQALRLEPGDEVITSPFTFVATLNAILEAGATARFADIADDFCIDPGSIEALVGPNTRAIMPVHLYGLPADMTEIAPLAERHGVALVEDAAQAHGALVAGRPVGSYGLGCFSMYATKNITAGEGGVVTTNDAELADRLRLLRNQGMRDRYRYEIAGHNYRMTEMQAALAIPQLRRLREITRKRRSNAAALSDGLLGIDGLVLPTSPPGRDHVFHQYTVRVTADASITRDELRAVLEESNIRSGIYYPRLLPAFECYATHPSVASDPTPVALGLTSEVLSLPVHQLLRTDDLARIVKATRGAFT